jgi:hypothetical protein
MRLGGRNGYLYANWLGLLRGWLDRLVGGFGSRGRKDDNIRQGDTLDLWRVERLVPGHAMRLGAEMKIPGTAWLDFATRHVPAVSGS